MKTLIDANVLIRAHDPKPSPYGPVAVKLLTDLAESGEGYLSSQSLVEFAHYLIHQHHRRTHVVAAQVCRLATVFPVLPVTGEVVKRALRAMQRQPIGYFDAQVWAIARLNGVRRVVSEGSGHNFVRDKVLYYDLIQRAPTFGWVPERPQ